MSTGWTRIDGLADPAPADVDGPAIDVLTRATAVTVIRIGFRAGQVMRDHRAARPILIVGQHGDVDLAVAGETTRLSPGAAVHLEAGVPHALTAVSDATVTLLVLDRPGPG